MSETMDIEKAAESTLAKSITRFVMPVLMLLALTGGLYLFKDEIDGLLYRDMIRVPAVKTQAAPDAWVASAAQAA